VVTKYFEAGTKVPPDKTGIYPSLYTARDVSWGKRNKEKSSHNISEVAQFWSGIRGLATDEVW
jgi:hypothetical protein